MGHSRSQRHLREVRGYDSGGYKSKWFTGIIPPPITGAAPASASFVAAGAAGRNIATFVPTGGTAPFTYAVSGAAGVAASFSPNTSSILKNTADPAGTAGLKNMTILITDSKGQTRSHPFALTLT